VKQSGTTALARSRRVSGKFCRVLANSEGPRRFTDSFTDSGRSGPPNSLVPNQLKLEARVGIEPTMRLLQSPALPLGYPATVRGDDREPPFGRKPKARSTPATLAPCHGPILPPPPTRSTQGPLPPAATILLRGSYGETSRSRLHLGGSSVTLWPRSVTAAGTRGFNNPSANPSQVPRNEAWCWWPTALPCHLRVRRNGLESRRGCRRRTALHLASALPKPARIWNEGRTAIVPLDVPFFTP
jgi:hypothetical protein